MELKMMNIIFMMKQKASNSQIIKKIIKKPYRFL